MQSLVKTRIYQMAKATGTIVEQRHIDVLEFAWDYHRKRRVGPLYNNIRNHTGVTRAEIEKIFPNGLSSVYTWVGIPVQSTANGCKPMALLEVDDPREIYLDNNATTPLRPEVIEVMVSLLQDTRSFGNPSSSYIVGSEAYDLIDRSRKRIANALDVEAKEIYFTGSGSEANNLAIKGIALPRGKGHLITSNVEHPSVLECMHFLEGVGYSVTYLPAGRDGTIAAEDVANAIRGDTILVSIMAANNEIGTIYPFAEIGQVCKKSSVPFMVDGIQAFGKIPLAPKQASIDILTLSGHKIQAPKGVAAIFVNQGLELATQIHGGSQEAGLRAGTENVLGIVALGLAAELAVQEIPQMTRHYLNLREHFLTRLHGTMPEAVINGTMERRLVHNLSIGFPSVDSGSLLLSLNQIGVYVSAGSACSAGDEKISHVLEAIGADSENFGTLRFSFGPASTREDIDYVFEHLPKIMDQLGAIDMVYRKSA